MRSFFTSLRGGAASSASSAAPPAPADERATPPPPTPVPLGVPQRSTALAACPVQGTVAVGSERGEVHLFSSTSGAELRLPPPPPPPTSDGGANATCSAAVLHLLFLPNAGTLVVVHAPDLICVWTLRRGATSASAALIGSFHAGPSRGTHNTQARANHAIAVATLASPLSPFVLFGSVAGEVSACDAALGCKSTWRLTLPPLEDSGTAGAVCALELKPSDAKLPLLVGLLSGRLHVFDRLLQDGERSHHVAFAQHPSNVSLTCAAWLADGSDGVVAGYANGDVLAFSLRNPSAPSATFAITVGAPTPAGEGDAVFRRTVRSLRAVGAAAATSKGEASRGASTMPRQLVLQVAGGTALEGEPDGITFLRGADFRERSLLAPPRGAVLSSACVGSRGAALLPNGAPAEPTHLYLLTTQGELFCHSMRYMGAAPRRYPDGVFVDPSAVDRVRVRLALTPCGGGRVLAALSTSTPERPASASVAQAPHGAHDALPSPFFDPGLRWEGVAESEGLLTSAVGWLKHVGSSGSGGGSSSSSWLSEGLSWAESSLAKHSEAARSAPVDALRRLLSPQATGEASARVSSGAGSKGANETDARELLGLSGSHASARERAEARLRAHRAQRAGAPPSACDAAVSRASAATSTIHESLEAMHERGEKLDQLGDKSQQLADDADDFLSLAKQLRKQEERGFFGLF